MKFKTMSVTVIHTDRSNRSGFTPEDYARDAAAEINQRMNDAGISSWQAGAPDDDACEYSTRRFVEREIAACDESIRGLLVISLDEHEIDE